ncbi:hypothetical protein GCK32_012640 [Trichostrongylus colubriformis]|uniref:Uncharacterized protein n=1 Tax=Trichostrongylus colubriformis TaxID=6319 RepID=A0AAN8FKC1_TRICO
MCLPSPLRLILVADPYAVFDTFKASRLLKYYSEANFSLVTRSMLNNDGGAMENKDHPNGSTKFRGYDTSSVGSFLCSARGFVFLAICVFFGYSSH